MFKTNPKPSHLFRHTINFNVNRGTLASESDISTSDEKGHKDSDVNNDLEDPARVPVDKNFPESKFLESLFSILMMYEKIKIQGKRLSF